MEEHLNLQTYYWKNSSPERLSELDFEYHKYYYEICNKMQCHAMVQNMNIHFDRVRHISILIQKDLKLVDDHRKIFEAVRARDPVLAHQLVCKHLTRYQVEKEAIEEAFLQYFK